MWRMRLLSIFAAPAEGPALHRWCHRTSPTYATTCDWIKKVDAANADANPAPMAGKENGPSTPKGARLEGQGERDCVSVLAVDSYGF